MKIVFPLFYANTLALKSMQIVIHLVASIDLVFFTRQYFIIGYSLLILTLISILKIVFNYKNRFCFTIMEFYYLLLWCFLLLGDYNKQLTIVALFIAFWLHLKVSIDKIGD